MSAQAPDIRTLDFAEPARFTANVRRRLEQAMERFCEAASERLSAELRAPVEARVRECAQLTWAAGRAQLPASAIAVTVQARAGDAPAGSMLLSTELAFALHALECLLGGSPGSAGEERRLTGIDWALLEHLMGVLAAQLSAVWEELGGPGLRLGAIDLEGEAGVLVPTGEATLLLSVDCQIDGCRSAVALLIPWSAVDGFAARIRAGAGGHAAAGAAGDGGADSRQADAVRRGLASAYVTLRAQLGSVQMPIEQVVALSPGAVLALGERVRDGVWLSAEGVCVGRGRAGRSGGRRAVKLHSSRHDHAAPERHLPPQLAASQRHARHERAASRRHTAISVPVWAELGRTRVTLAAANALGPGALVELHERVEEPVELFAAGRCLAHGELVVAGEGEWGFRVERLL